jgi:hypothetical protein
MVACGIMELSPKARADIKAPALEPIVIKMAKEYTSITIGMGDNGTINTSLEELHEQLEKDIY